MRVAHVIVSLDPAQGGPPAVVARLAAAESACGANVRVIANDPGTRAPEVMRSLAEVSGLSKVEIYFTEGQLSFKEAVKSSRPDVVHVHGMWQPGLMFALQWARSSRIPFVITPHGMVSSWSLEQKPWRKRLALLSGWRELLHCADAVHALNEAESADIARIAPRATIEIIPNGVNAAEFEPLADGARGERPRYVLFLARLHRMKGPDLAVSAFATIAEQFPDVRFLMAGPDDGEASNLSAVIRELGMTERIRLLGPVYGAEKKKLLAGASCMLQPSRYEGQSITLLEALAAGVPLVLTPQCNFPEAQSAGAALVTDPTPAALGAALALYLSDEERRRTSAQRGVRLINERFQWASVGERFVALYGRFATARGIQRKLANLA